MSFKSSFLHSISSYNIPGEQNLRDFLPTDFSYSTQAAEHLIYLKAAGTITLPSNAHYTQNNFHSYLLIRPLSGSASLSIQGVDYSLYTNSVCLIDCRNPYTLHCSTTWECQVLFFDGYPVPYYYELFTSLGSPVIQLADNALLFRLFERLIAQNYPNKELMNAELLTRILTQLVVTHQDTPSETGIPAYLLSVKELLDTHYSNHYTLDTLAENFHINKYQICRDFKKHMNTSPLQYLNNIRLTHAMELLKGTSLHINEISWQVGFENTNHFIQLFKKKIGVTPTAYRKSA